jgi:glycine betaine/choline ABC-type transport system substrate-binding protein
MGGMPITQKALQERQIDLSPGSTGTMLLVVLKARAVTGSKAIHDEVQAEYAAKGTSLATARRFENGADALAVTAPQARVPGALTLAAIRNRTRTSDAACDQ